VIENLIGRQLGKYEIQAEIGRGGMGLVFRGYDHLLDRQVAIKVLAPHLVWEPGFVERFLREARSAARLKHASIVTIFDVGQEGDRYYIVMEFLKGPTLADLIRKRGALPADDIVSITRQLAGALDYAHHCGVVHRDVKPGNVVIDPSGRATLTDFGVARAGQETRLTTTGALIGTPQYMSPEQAQGDEVGHETDIYSLGVVVYEMLAGRAPFDATTPHAVLHQLIYDPPPPLSSVRPGLPPQLDSVLASALAKQPAARYHSGGAFVTALETTLRGQEAPQTPAARTSHPVSVPPPPAAPAEHARPVEAAPTSLVSQPRAKSRRWHRTRLWLAWLLLSVMGWAIGWGLGVYVGEFAGRAAAPSGEPFFIEAAAGAATWGVLALILGTAQWFMLRRYLPRAGWWILATLFGFAVVGSIKWGQGMLLDEFYAGAAYELEVAGWGQAIPALGIGVGLVVEGLTGFVVGLPQWLALQGKVRRAGRWLLISTLAWALGGASMSAVGWAIGEVEGEYLMLAMPVIGGCVSSGVAGLGLVRMLAAKTR
jgi:serine/threonine protein kinase